MSNPAYSLIKIGKSAKDPTRDRASELYQTGVPEPMKVEYYAFVEDENLLEQLVHKHFDAYRPNKNREFFNLDISTAVATIREIAYTRAPIKYDEVYYVSDEVFIGEPINQGTKPEDIITQYPKAAKVLEYNETARTYFDKLVAVPGNTTEDFLSVLESDPNISALKLDQLFDKPIYRKYFKPFDSAFANYFYELCLQENMNIALEFKNDFELLSKSISAKQMFIKLCNKHRIKIDKYNIKGQPFFNSLSKSITSIKEIKDTDLQALFSEINLSIISHHTGTFTVSHEQKILLDHIYGPNLLVHMKDGLSLGRFLELEEYSATNQYTNYQMKKITDAEASEMSERNLKKDLAGDISLKWAFYGIVIIAILVFFGET